MPPNYKAIAEKTIRTGLTEKFFALRRQFGVQITLSTSYYNVLMAAITALLVFLTWNTLMAGDASAPKPSAAKPAPTLVSVGYLKQQVVEPIPLSRLNVKPDDLGIAGARIASKDNNTTGKFTNQRFTLQVVDVPVGGDAVAALNKLVESGHRLILVDAPADILLQLSDAVKAQDVLLFNVSAPDVHLRQKDCRANVLHTAPDLAMLADALAQYLVWKKWQRWLVATGVYPEDQAYLEAIRRAAKRFGATIVAEREYKEEPGARRSDTGQQLIQKQMPVFTQGAPSYDVLIVADRRELFGPYLPFRTWDPRPVAGTAGLEAMSWHPAHEQWGATQIQNRFQKFAGRFMLPLDYQAWVAVRAIGEGASRARSADVAAIETYLRSDKFDLAAFKGQKVTFRKWDGQMRQPIIIADAELPVSTSPQQGFLHQHAEIDTLGIDEPESLCHF